MLLRTLTALGLTAVLVFTLRTGFAADVRGWSVIVIYLLFYIPIELLGRRRRGDRGDTDDEAGPDCSFLPISGPIGRFGRLGLALSFFSSQLLMLLNPFQVLQAIRQLVGNAALRAREQTSGDDGRDYLSRVAYRLPFDGEWLLYSGGMTPKTSHSWDLLGQRYALDFLICDAAYRRHIGRGTQVTDYFAYGCPILAAADGEVIAVENRIGDAPLVGWGICDFTARSFIGNFVLIRHDEAEYGLYAHLIRGSVEVAPGDQVEAGQQIGRCGHSGHSSEPHLHFHIQDSPDLFRGMGRPITFHDIEIDGVYGARAQLSAGQLVAQRRPVPTAPDAP